MRWRRAELYVKKVMAMEATLTRNHMILLASIREEFNLASQGVNL